MLNWLDKAEYPFQSNYFEIDGYKMHYIDEGQGDVLFFLHGTPSWSFEYRNQIKELSKNYRCIAPDYIGFGLSDKPEIYNYSTLNHSISIGRLIKHLKIDKMNLILHDFGGPIGFNFAINNPEKIDNIVVMNSWLWSSANDPKFIKFSKILKSPLLPFLYKYLNFSARYLLPKSFGSKKINKHIHKHYTKPFANSKERNGTLAFAKSLLNDQNWFEELWNQRGALRDKRFLFIWGMSDTFVGKNELDKFLRGFNLMYELRINECGHFPQEEDPETVNAAILEFLNN